MVVRRSLLLLVLASGACSDDRIAGPFDKLPQDAELVFDGDNKLDGPVQVARDQYGVAHVSATTVRDVGFAQGYVMAHDRLPQMDVLRRFGAGTLSELFGALDPTVIDTDLEMRMHRMKPLAEQAWAELQQHAAEGDPTDREVVDLLQRFSDGVNAYAADLVAGKWTLDPLVQDSFPPDKFVAWSPVDSLVLGRFQAFALSWSTPFELDLDELYSRLRADYDTTASTDPARVARKGISRDLMTFQPVGLIPTIDGFPNVTVDTGSSSDGSPRKQAAGTAVQAGRATVAQSTYDRAQSFFHRGVRTGPFGSFGPHAFMRPFAGSNNWAVAPQLAGGAALLATDQHLQLPNPSIFYPTHLIVRNANGGTDLDVLGITFPGIPGVILGSNGKLAWSATVSEHDVNDLYREAVVACPQGECVKFNATTVPIETFEETIIVGALGTETARFTATYETVPHHGPIIPAIDPVMHRLVPRPPLAEALSVKYTGYDPTFEIRALWNLSHAASVDDGFRALSDFSFGSQNWTMIDDQAQIGWTTNAFVPERSPASYTWNATTRPDGAAPFFILDGQGGFEWERRMSPRYVPHAKNPASGYLATSNADPVGATFDNDPLNQPMVDGRPLYVGVSYAAGVREERISTLIDQAARPLTLDTMAQIQHDTHSNVGAKLSAPIALALARLDTPTGAPADLGPFVAALSAEDKARLVTARTLLASWTHATPTALAPNDPAAADSAATALFNAWMHFFLERALRDEFANAKDPATPGAQGFDLYRLDGNQLVRIVYALLTRPGAFVQSAATGQPIVCDDFASVTTDSCTTMIMRAAIDAVRHLETTFASPDPAQWRWGQLHQLVIEPLFPNASLDLPRSGELATRGFPKAGDNFAINRADHGWADLDFSQFADGPAQRFLAIAEPGQPIAVKWQLPGGVIFDSRDPHYRDLLDKYYLPEVHFDAPFSVPQILENGEYRWDLR
jgi:penicillin amidase